MLKNMKKNFIRTIKGDIVPAQLGWCQCHEHLFLADGPSRRLNKALYMDNHEKSLAELVRYKQAGGQSIVDAQPFGCGRMAEKLIKVSDQAGVNIIACTGFHKTEFFTDKVWLDKQTEETLTEIYLEEIEKGLYSVDNKKLPAKAGIIKCAAIGRDRKENKTYAKLFSAAATAAVITGIPIMVHMDIDSDAFSIISFFEKYNIQPDKIMFCHLDRVKYDFTYHKEIADVGSFLEYDTINRLKYHSNEKEIELIVHMVENGFVNKLLLAMDTTNQRLKSYGADFGLDYILTEFTVPLEQQLDKEIIRRIMIENPADALSF